MRMFRILAAAICLAFTALASAHAAPADDVEHITDYRSDITVQRDGVLAVRETITVNALGDEISHGIFRDFPTLGQNGVHASFNVSAVTRDGKPEPFEIDRLDGGKRVKIGDADTELSHGTHTYTIAYTTDRQIHFFPTYDEFYWNVTGNGWDFHIERAEATVHLPPGARILQSAFYTGTLGETLKEAASEQLTPNTIRFVTTDRLSYHSGLTIALGFTKGAVPPPTQSQLTAYFLRDHLSIFVMLAGVILMALYYLIAWLRVGIDPSDGTVVPLFEAPNGMSAAEVRFLRKHLNYDNKMFAAALVSLAVKGALKITQEKDETYTLTRTSEGEDLSPDESAVERTIFVESHTVTLTQADHFSISLAVGAQTKKLSDAYGDGYEIGNWSWFWPGLVILLLAAIAMIFCSASPGDMALTILWTSLCGGATAGFAYMDFSMWRNAYTTRSGRIGNLFAAFFMLFPAFLFGAMTSGALLETYDTASPIAVGVLLAGVALAALFHRLLRKPTPRAAKLLAAIEGLRLFLTTAEQDRLEKLNPPQITPEVFEKFLPYAIALDCENQWSKRFEAEAARAGASVDVQNYRPIWFHGDFGQLGTAALAASIGSTLTTAATAASFTASSGGSGGFSSGSFGGGFSGGGGGGGGGGGW
ncbi:MAG TPA: DUF2207 domain-containing protein [Rhizomicrobium sp.]|jgi:uncharacterized membrane protein YgcG|nr:DUF2207 domain-containing protein [Rhizomicrobium sp.]